jgi:hypothetical protein
MILAHMTREDSRMIEDHPWITAAVVIVLFVLGWVVKK